MTACTILLRESKCKGATSKSAADLSIVGLAKPYNVRARLEPIGERESFQRSRDEAFDVWMFRIELRRGELFMNPMDILASILGSKAKSGGRGGDVLNDMFKRRSPRPKSNRESSTTNIDKEAKELEDLLNVANDGHSRSTTRSTPSSRSRSTPAPTSAHDDKAVLLIRAMVNAAKADGRMDDQEQQKIIKQLRSPTNEAIDFLRQEFARPVNVQEFARSVPVGMEQQVYTMSLIAIDLDTGDEAKYLMQLADSLRLSDEVREQIHQRLGAPSIY